MFTITSIFTQVNGSVIYTPSAHMNVRNISRLYILIKCREKQDGQIYNVGCVSFTHKYLYVGVKNQN